MSKATEMPILQTVSSKLCWSLEWVKMSLWLSSEGLYSRKRHEKEWCAAPVAVSASAMAGLKPTANTLQILLKNNNQSGCTSLRRESRRLPGIHGEAWKRCSSVSFIYRLLENHKTRNNIKVLVLYLFVRRADVYIQGWTFQTITFVVVKFAEKWSLHAFRKEWRSYDLITLKQAWHQHQGWVQCFSLGTSQSSVPMLPIAIEYIRRTLKKRKKAHWVSC